MTVEIPKYTGKSFDELLSESVRLHGHLCAGQVIGVRLSMLGLRLMGVTDPKGRERKDFVVYVEIDRCATDAIQSVTGCSLGKRSLKWIDFGIMAATFVHLPTKKGFRILAREDARELARNYCPEIEDKYRQQLEAYKRMRDDELFDVQEVRVNIPECDLPGRPLRRVRCVRCGEYVQDCRDVERNGEVLCKACAGSRYYEIVSNISV
ncbi:MAG: FmdE family protein [Dissulfurimicrobium sp.]|uniref:FmdE family protein n=1 Tax=Dissulfurimicrobium sp. TaxID=2022436 RepID=UPI00404A4924